MRALSKTNSRTIQAVPIDRLKPYLNNPLNHPPKQLRKIKALIDQHGQIPIILVASDLTIVAGEEWWLALKDAGKTEVQVQILADLSPAEANTIRLALGRLPLDARLDRGRLRAELGALQAQGIDLDLTGFDRPEINLSLEIEMPASALGEDIESIRKDKDHAVSRPGDIFQVGVHSVGCGDVHDQALLDRLRQGRPANLCVSEPRFGLKHPSGAVGHNEGRFIETSGDELELDCYRLIHDLLRLQDSARSKTALIYVFLDWPQLFALTAAGKQVGLRLADFCVWLKPKANSEGLYRARHELIAVFQSDSEARAVELEKSRRKRSNVWSYDPVVIKRDVLGSGLSFKPVPMLADILRDSTKRGDLVLATFLGWGSTLIAAEQTGRTCVAVEPDPLCLDVSIRRWQAITGRQAIHLATGQRFDHMSTPLLTQGET